MTAATRRVRSKLGNTAIRSLAPSEASIKQTCTEWLALDGWRAVETDPPHMRGLGVTEKGITDKLYIRYFSGHRAVMHVDGVGELAMALAQVLWIEWKKKGGKAKQHQKDWHYTERMRGAVVWVAGADFAATIESFQAFYRKSGLMRRKI